MISQRPGGFQRVTVLQVFVCAAAAWIVLFVANPVLAKLPEFGVTIEPTSPTAGEPVTVTVEFADSLPVEIGQMSALLAFYRAEDADWRSNGVPVSPIRVDGTIYVGQVVIPEP